MADTRVAPRRLPFPIGTRVVFAQASPPLDWVQDTDPNLNNKYIRLVDGLSGISFGGQSGTTSSYSGAMNHEHDLADHSHSMMGGEGGHKHNMEHDHTVYATDLSTDPELTNDNYWVYDNGGSRGADWYQKSEGHHINVNVSPGIREGHHRHYCYDTQGQSSINTGSLYSSTGLSEPSTSGSTVDMTHNHSINSNFTPKYVDVIVAILTG